MSGSLKAAVLLVVVAAVVGVLLWRELGSEAANLDGDDLIGFRQAQARLGCGEPEPIDDLEGPIRSGAADRGVKCSLEGETVHLFEAARIGKWGGLDYRDPLGVGDVEDPERPQCPVQVTVGRGLIIVSPSTEAAERVQELLDLRGTTQPMAYPPGSYQLPC